MLAVVPAAPAEDRPLVRWSLEMRVGKHRADRRAVFGLETLRIRRDAACNQSGEQIIDLEQLGDEAPAPVEPVAHSSVPSPSRTVHSAASSR